MNTDELRLTPIFSFGFLLTALWRMIGGFPDLDYGKQLRLLGKIF